MASPLFSIIIACHEGHDDDEMLRRTMESLRRQSLQDFEILLYHDGPRAVPFAEALDLGRYPKLSHVESTEVRQGDFGHSLRDLGIARAIGDYVIQLDADCILYDSALDQIARSMEVPRKRIVIEQPSGRFVKTLDETADGHECDVFIFSIIRIGMECDGLNYWMNAKHDARHGMLMTGRPALPQLLDLMQLAVRRSLWDRYGGWYDKTAGGHGEIYARLIQENWARCIPAILGEHW